MATRWWVWGLLTAILITASILRLDGITRVGVRFDDEGAYVGDARLWHRCALVLADHRSLRSALRGDKAALKRRMDELGIDFAARYAKPGQGYTFLGAATMFVVGDRPAALLVLNAVSGVLAVLVIYAIGTTLFGPWPGLCAALFLALSPYHLFYCRSAFADATAGLFVLLGLWVWIVGIKRGWSVRRAYGLSGVLFGYAATCHYRCLYVPGILLLADILIRRVDSPQSPLPKGRYGRVLVEGGPDLRGLKPAAPSMARRWLWFAAGAVLPAISIELVFRAARFAASVSDGYFPIDTYFEASFEWFRSVLAVGTSDAARDPTSLVRSAVAYASYYVHWQGVAAALLTLTGVAVVVCKRGLARIPALFVLTTFALLANQPYTVARAMATAIPMLCLCAAVGLFWIANSWRLHHRWRTAVVTALLTLFLAPAIKGSLHVHRGRSGIADACAFVASRGPALAAVSIDTYHRSKYWLYLEGTDVDVLNRRFDKLGSPETVIARLKDDGVRWFIIDPQRWHFRDTPPGPRNRVFRWWEMMDDYLSREAYVAAEFPHIVGFCWEFLSEGPGLTHLDEMMRRRAGRLRVYDLNRSAGGPAMEALSSSARPG